MKCLKSGYFLAVLAWVLPLSFAFAQGGGMDGGGGDVVILEDDEVVLADPFVSRPHPRGVEFTLHPQIVAELRLLGKLLNRYGATATSDDKCVFIEDQVLSPTVEYRFAAELPVNCERVPVEQLPKGAVHELAACTKQFRTWIREDLFRRMTIREQALLILHERLRALLPAPEAGDIADITVGSGALLRLYFSQVPMKSNQVPEYEKGDTETLELLRKRIVQLGIGQGRSWSEWRVWPNGGGIIHSAAQVAPSAFVGVGSVIGAKSQLADQSQVLGLTDCVTGHCVLESHAILMTDQGKELNGIFFLGERSAIMHSNLGRSQDSMTVLGDNAYIRNSSLNAPRIQLGDGAAIDDVELFFIAYAAKVTLEDMAYVKNVARTLVFTMSRVAGGLAGELVFKSHVVYSFEGPVCNRGEGLGVWGSKEFKNEKAARKLCYESYLFKDM